MAQSSVAPEKSETALILAAKSGSEAAFRGLIEPLGRELSAYAYRMLGGFQDAEDALQETRLKAWRHLDSYQPEASFRAWVYRIATNTCLDLLRQDRRRQLPQDVGPPVAPGPPTTDPRNDLAWLEPYPDALLPSPPTSDPEAALRLQQSVRLAFIRAMQLLPPRQRAALILHDVLDFAVDDVAAMLETTAAGVNSALQRARATVQAPGPHAASKADAQRVTAHHAAALAECVHAWETGNFERLIAMLTADAVMSMPPWIYWQRGRDTLAATFLSPGTWNGEPRAGRYRIVSAPMNGQPGALAYVKGADGRYVRVCLTLMDVDANGHVYDMTVFVLPEYFDAWGYPQSLE